MDLNNDLELKKLKDKEEILEKKILVRKKKIVNFIESIEFCKELFGMTDEDLLMIKVYANNYFGKLNNLMKKSEDLENEKKINTDKINFESDKSNFKKNSNNQFNIDNLEELSKSKKTKN
jgi:hypothetical protein